METFITALKSSEYGLALPYAHGYTAYISDDDETSGYFISYCKGEMPPHQTERVATAEEAARKLTEIADLSCAYAIEAN